MFINCSFLIGKFRQTPKKSVTIPRLELSAAVVATRLNLMMQHKLDVVIDESFLWSDSTCVLSYNANRDKWFQTFVANRIAAIHEGSRASHSKYVDTGPTRQTTRQEGCQLKSCVAANSGFVALTFCRRKNRLGLNSRML